MARRKLSDEERHFRRVGSGIPFSRWWPALAILLAAIVVAASTNVVLECTGLALEGRGRGKAAVEMLLIYPCSPFLLRDGVTGWFWFALLWMPLPFAVVNWRWAGRQRGYWNEVRLREAERRKARRVAAKIDQSGD